MQITGKNIPRQPTAQSAKISAIAEIAPHLSRDKSRDAHPRLNGTIDTLPASQALVPVGRETGSVARPVSRAGRMSAPLVTHLVATRMGLPQTRNRRRASADHVTNAYRQVTRAPHIRLTGTSASKYL